MNETFMKEKPVLPLLLSMALPNVLSMLVTTGLCPSRGEARRLVQQGGVTIDDVKVASIDESLARERFEGEGVIVRKGKKVFHRVKV